ncbi:MULTISPECIES: DUF4192 family protein [unclassified Streptomyces]|uniref:DUF4192 domain-containing protein n=1 Tax=unclassified Streptomyces TaxID=2593676 RepID=UPI0024752654|nr:MULTISPECIES: DUF4192 family protein [unclassified Streptomyces]MDH6453407.1 hypothetical protein [Streptomyces sp. SAI-119]MDH6496038.1 hypothetical protein [Streptomyces sp. SAI-149]
MTNHSETAGPAANGSNSGRNSGGRNTDGQNTDGQNGAGRDNGRRDNDGSGIGDRVGFDAHGAEHQVTLRTPGELADALPYLLGYRPEDSIVLVALHDQGGRGRFGGRARLGIPANKDDWSAVARQLAHGLITGSERRGARPEQMVAYLCQEPGAGETGREITERLAPLAGLLRTECGRLDVPVIEALCISDGRYWSYCCPSEECCPAEGVPMGLPGTSVLAAAATYAGLQVRGTLRELRARLQPWETAAALEQEVALDTAGMALVPRMLDEVSRAEVAEETVRLARRTMTRLAEAAPVAGPLQADLRDDELLGHDEAAELILGLQDRTTRDRAAEWMEAEEAGPALRLWRALARRCVGPYGEHAAAPLTLAGWVAWSGGDEIEAREALAMALGADSGYLFARLLHQACNEGLDPESIRRCLRAERESRDARARSEATQSAAVKTTEDLNRPSTPAPDRKPPTTSHPSGDVTDATSLPGNRMEAPSACPPPAERALPSCPAETDPALPAPQPTTAGRRRKRVRPGARTEALPRPTEAEGRQACAEGSRPRTRPARGTRPGAVRRTTGKDGARRPEGTRPGSGATEEEG